jgi:hypothetical protein
MHRLVFEDFPKPNFNALKEIVKEDATDVGCDWKNRERIMSRDIISPLTYPRYRPSHIGN